MEERLIILGADNFAREVSQWVNDVYKKNPTHKFVGFLSVNNDVADALPAQVIGSAELYTPLSNDKFICGISEPSLKRDAVNKLLDKGAQFINIIHPTANIAQKCTIGNGVVVFPFATISANTYVGNFVTVLFSGMGHDAIAEDYVTIGSGCDITGGVIIKEAANIRAGSVIIPHKTIGANSTVEMGSVVIRNVQPESVVAGNPARRKKL
ncbi:MAG: sugar O-acyltransferase [Christensenella sp.]